MTRLIFTAAFLALSSASAHAQFWNVTVCPTQAPVGGDITITISKDSPGFLGSGPCPFQIYDANQNLVFAPSCNPVIIDVGPYGWITNTWNQRDQNGVQVPPGDYWARVTFEPGLGAPVFVPFTIGGDEPALCFVGTATVGQTLTGQPRNYVLTSPQDPGAGYWLMVALSMTTGFPTCNGTFPLDIDPLLVASATPGKVIKNSLGVLNGNGKNSVPTLPLPTDPTLIGVNLHSAYAIVDFADPCFIKDISVPWSMQIIG